jgi:hypothetical protein
MERFLLLELSVSIEEERCYERRPSMSAYRAVSVKLAFTAPENEV